MEQFLLNKIWFKTRKITKAIKEKDLSTYKSTNCLVQIMNEKKTLAFVFVFLLTFTVLSIFFLILNIHLFFQEIFYHIILTLSFLNLFIAIWVLRKFLAEVYYEVNEKKDKEKNARDCFLYHQLFNPPEIDN